MELRRAHFIAPLQRHKVRGTSGRKARKSTPKHNMKVRPVLGNRMPTLGNNAIFFLPINPDHVSNRARKSLQGLSLHPPKHLKEVRSILVREIAQIGRLVSDLEQAYFGFGKNIDDELSRVVPHVQLLMRVGHVPRANTKKIVDRLIKDIYHGHIKFEGDSLSLNTLKSCYTKTRQFVSKEFKIITEPCAKIFNYLCKYCVSFYNTDSDCQLDTAAQFEEQIQSFKSTIEDNLQNIQDLEEQFKTDGLSMDQFSDQVRNLGELHLCTKAPFLLMFSEVCANIRLACYTMTKWITADESFASYLRYDVDDLEKRRNKRMRWMRDAREKFHTLTYRLAQAEVDLAKLSIEVGGMVNREGALAKEEDAMVSRCTGIQLELDVKSHRIKELKQEYQWTKATALLDTLDYLATDVKVIAAKLPTVQKSLSQIRYKLDWIRMKQTQLSKADTDIKEIRQELQNVTELKKKREQEYVDTECVLELARKIYLLKTTGNVMEKIFYDLPFEIRVSKVHVEEEDNDPLSRACDVVAAHIGHDWPKLYRSLPFTPSRGSVILDHDIRNIEQASRINRIEQAQRCLTYWRRFHTRARVDELLGCVDKIQRSDIAHHVDVELHPELYQPPPEVLEDYESLDVDPELIPFYKQGDRYDKLRASKKINF